MFETSESNAKENLIKHPETGEFLRGAQVEAAYQRQRYPEQPSRKDAEWLGVSMFILGKILDQDTDDEHRLHHIEAAAALLANWHRVIKERNR